MLNRDLKDQPNKLGQKPSRNSFWIILVVLFLILIGAMLFWVFRGTQTGRYLAPEKENFDTERTDNEIVSELQGIQFVFENYYQENKKYPIKTDPEKLTNMREEVTGLAGYDDERLKGAEKKDFLYQSDEAGTKYVLFATLPKESSQIKDSPPEGFTMPEGYNYSLGSQ